jgi:hypothetical protein
MINGTAPADVPQAAPPAPAKRGSAVASADQPSSASDQFSVSALGYTSH